MAVIHPCIVVPDDGGYVVIFPDLPGAMTQGDTLAEAMTMAADAYDLWIATESAHGASIPAPFSATPERWSQIAARLATVDREG